MHYTVIVGSGKTSRVNVEALLDDHLYGKPQHMLVFCIAERASEGQVYAAQYAKDIGKDVLIIAAESAALSGMPASTIIENPDPLQAAFLEFADQTMDVFILWDDNEPECTRALALATSRGISAKDLTSGLVTITPVADLKVDTPVEIPKVERAVAPVVTEPEDLEDEYDEEDDEEDDEELDVEETLTDAINVIAQIFAQEIARELKKLLK